MGCLIPTLLRLNLSFEITMPELEAELHFRLDLIGVLVLSIIEIFPLGVLQAVLLLTKDRPNFTFRVD
jgi:hypothetical protein